jgi:hypothetical protein
MNSQLDPDIFDDLFHGCALTAFLQEARLHQAWPDREQTRRRAYRLYEQQLACQPRNLWQDRQGNGAEPYDCGFGVTSIDVRDSIEEPAIRRTACTKSS